MPSTRRYGMHNKSRIRRAVILELAARTLVLEELADSTGLRLRGQKVLACSIDIVVAQMNTYLAITAWKTIFTLIVQVEYMQGVPSSWEVPHVCSHF